MPLPTLILASRSPRRAQLLKRAGYRVRQVDPPFDDPAQPADDDGLPPEQMTCALALQKARSLFNDKDLRLTDGSVIVAADTVVVGPDSRLIGQPSDMDHARRMLLGFVNTDHDVVSGVAIVTAVCPDAICFADRATVTIGRLDPQRIEQFLRTGRWQGKAGGYNLTKRLADGWPISVRGDQTTVVGLPMNMLGQRLAGVGIHPDGQSTPAADVPATLKSRPNL